MRLLQIMNGMKNKMKKLFFYTVWDFTNAESDGICKKIISQINVFEQYGYVVDYSFTRNGDTYIRKDGEIIKVASYNRIWNKLFANKQLALYIKKNKYDGIYCRYACADWYFIRFLKNSFQNKNCKVIIELPSYPYDEEIRKDIIGKTFLMIDKFHRGRMKRYVDRVTVFSEDKKVFGIPSINTMNGIDFSRVSIRKPGSQMDVVNIITVATIANWHGYDRLLEGIGKYYEKGGKREVHFHLVGGGHAEEIERLKRIVKKHRIEEKVTFYGPKYGKELDAIYDKCDLAAECFGQHRKNVSGSSSLKSREYMAKGLPVITANNIDVLDGCPPEYCFKCPADETPVDIDSVLNFFDIIYHKKTKEELAKEIRQFAEQICDMKITMKPVADYFSG